MMMPPTTRVTCPRPTTATARQLISYQVFQAVNRIDAKPVESPEHQRALPASLHVLCGIVYLTHNREHTNIMWKFTDFLHPEIRRCRPIIRLIQLCASLCATIYLPVWDWEILLSVRHWLMLQWGWAGMYRNYMARPRPGTARLSYETHTRRMTERLHVLSSCVIFTSHTPRS